VTTPAPNEQEEELIPGGFEPSTPKPGYKYPKPTEKPRRTAATHASDEMEEEVLPGGQELTEPPNEYLPPDEQEEVLTGG